MPKLCLNYSVQLLSGAMCAAVLCAGGCKSAGGAGVSDGIEFAPGTNAPAPIDSASTRGLEVRLWVVDDTDWTAARLLADRVGTLIDEQTRARWADWGFRLVAIPVDEVDGLLEGLRPVQPINVQWLGEFGKWRAIIRTGSLRTETVRVGQRAVQIDQGRPRLIARSWIEPMLTSSDVVPGLRLDFGVQIETKDRKDYAARLRDEGYLGVTRERTIEDNGPVFDELLMSTVFDGTQALVILGEAPETNWNDLPDPVSLIVVDDSDSPDDVDNLESEEAPPKLSPAFGPGRDDQGGYREVAADRDERASFDGSTSRGPKTLEPSKPMGKTLGELMLMSDGSRIVQAGKTRIVPKRVIVILIPRVEGGFRLVPMTQAGGGNP